MSYVERFGHKAFFSGDAAAPEIVIDIGGASANAGELSCVVPCTVHQLQFHVTDEAVVGTDTAPTVVFTKRPTPNSATSESVVGTLTIPTGTAVGAVIYSELSTPVDFEVGDVMEISHTVGVGDPAGQGIAAFVCSHDPEVPGNMSDMTASA
jgi:hypothetical protein